MKNIFRIVMAVAILFTASCAKEDISSSIGGGEVEVTFTADLGQLGTRAYGEAENVDRVYLGIYEANTTKPLSNLVDPNGYAVVDGVASMTVVLLKDKMYDLVFWAQNNAQDCYSMEWDGRYVTVDYTGVESQNDARDAFFLVENDFKAGHDETTFYLYRPFAQLNAGLSAEDVTNITNNGVKVDSFQSKVVVRQVATKLNLLEEATDTALDVEDFETVTFALKEKPTQALTVNNVNYEYLSMNYLLVDAKQNVDVEFTFVDGEGTKYVRPYFQVPVQRNYRTNIIGQLISSPMDFNVIIVPDFVEPGNDLQGDTQTFDVYSPEKFKEALDNAATQNHIQHLVINLYTDVTLDVTAWQTLAIGNKNTQDITINGSKTRAAGDYYTLTFNNLNSDWNNIATNGAKLILNNLNITNSGKNDGPWNRHDINFACEVEMNNVVSDKALAFKAGATLKKTTITEDNTSDVYAIWIQPNGQTVTIEDCTINTIAATDGRGIKIDEQYVDAPKKVVLNVSGTSFATEEKAAVIVNSAAGAKIAWGEGNNISKVAADTEYAVWVDENAATYYDLVEVTGAKVRLEGSAVVATQQELEAAIEAGKTQINLAAANFTIPTQLNTAGLTNGTTVTLIGAGEATVLSFNSVAGGADGGLNSYADGLNLVFKNMAVVSPNTGSAYTGGFGRALSATFTNCKYNGQYRAVNANTKFEKCTIDPQTSYIYTDYANVDFVDCAFNCSKGKAIQVYNDANSSNTTINVTNCQFTATEVGYTWDNKPVTAIDINSNGEVFTVNINNSTATGFGVGLQSGNSLHNIKGGANYITIFVNGVCVHEPAPVADAEGNYTVKSAGALDTALKNIENGKTIKLEAGTYIIPDSAKGKTLVLEGKGDVVVAAQNDGGAEGNCDYCFDGANVTFKNITITTSGTYFPGYARMQGTFEDCTINGIYTIYESSSFKNCTFNISGDYYNLWTWGAAEVTLENCTFNCDGKAVLLYGQANTVLTVNGCTFNDNGGLADLKAAIEIGNDYNKSYELIVNNATVNGFEINDKGINTGTTLWANKNSMPQDKLNVVVDGVDVY